MRIRVVDSSPGFSVISRDWQYESPRLTLRELIEDRVRREVQTFNEHRPDVYRGLVQPEESEQILNGYRMKRVRELDPEQECARAVKAFENNAFLVFAGGKQLDSLEDEIDLESAGELEFVRLIPLIGG